MRQTAILLGLILGLTLGATASATGSPALLRAAEAVAPFGDAFMRAIQMVVIPLVAVTVFVGVAKIGNLRKLGRLGEMAPDVPALGVLAAESIFTQDQIASLLGEAPGDTEPLKWPAGNDALGALRRADLQHYLPDDLLCKVDTASMAVALEVRCPYLDRDLATAVAATHPRHLIRPGKRKALLRAIAQRHVPRAVLERPKMGFAIPIGLWFRTDFGGLRTLLLDHLNSAEPFGSIQLERKAIRGLVKEHMSGDLDHGHRLFALLTLSIWARSL